MWPYTFPSCIIVKSRDQSLLFRVVLRDHATSHRFVFWDHLISRRSRMLLWDHVTSLRSVVGVTSHHPATWYRDHHVWVRVVGYMSSRPCGVVKSRSGPMETILKGLIPVWLIYKQKSVGSIIGTEGHGAYNYLFLIMQRSYKKMSTVGELRCSPTALVVYGFHGNQQFNTKALMKCSYFTHCFDVWSFVVSVYIGYMMALRKIRNGLCFPRHHSNDITSWSRTMSCIEIMFGFSLC